MHARRGGFGSSVNVDQLERWQARERAAQLTTAWCAARAAKQVCDKLGHSMGTGGASSVAGKLSTDGWSDTASRHAACRLSAYIQVSFPPLPFARPKPMHTHMSACTCACTSVHMCLCIHGCINARMHAYVHACVHPCTHGHIDTCAQRYSRTHTQTCEYA